MVQPNIDPSIGRKERGAFFTPPAIADFLARFAIRSPTDRVLDPTCGEAVFLLAAGDRLKALKADPVRIPEQLTGVDLHGPSLTASGELLSEAGYGAQLIESDFFKLETPAQFGDQLGWYDAVIGNPPFIRYQDFNGDARARARAAAFAQRVTLSKLASSWAHTLVHSTAFLKPTGRLAMVLPAELLTVHYAEAVRKFLLDRFEAVNLFMFERLQFRDAEEQVVLLVAHGEGPGESFCIVRVDDAADLAGLHPGDPIGRDTTSSGKWTHLTLTSEENRLYRKVKDLMTPLSTYGQPELGTVTGANDFFTMTEATRRKYGIPEKHLKPISPPGTRHLAGLTFSRVEWEELKATKGRVWLLHPEPAARGAGLERYIAYGETEGVQNAYKCMIREPWWRPPVVSTPDVFFTYMSHRFPRLIANTSGATFVNSMHGIRLREDAPTEAQLALPLLSLNSATMLGGEMEGRAYGGGMLKMEPREAANLPVPTPDQLLQAWARLGERRGEFDAKLRRGNWFQVVAEVDAALLRDVMKLAAEDVSAIRDAATILRVRRTRQTEEHGG